MVMHCCSPDAMRSMHECASQTWADMSTGTRVSEHCTFAACACTNTDISLFSACNLQPNGWASAAGQCAVRVQAPVQVEILETTTLAEAEQMLRDAGLKPPLLVKPLWSDGREGSHGLAVLHDLQSMGKLLQGAISSDLKPPLVVQQFVEHGGVLYKVGWCAGLLGQQQQRQQQEQGQWGPGKALRGSLPG